MPSVGIFFNFLCDYILFLIYHLSVNAMIYLNHIFIYFGTLILYSFLFTPPYFRKDISKIKQYTYVLQTQRFGFVIKKQQQSKIC